MNGAGSGEHLDSVEGADRGEWCCGDVHMEIIPNALPIMWAWWEWSQDVLHQISLLWLESALSSCALVVVFCLCFCSLAEELTKAGVTIAKEGLWALQGLCLDWVLHWPSRCAGNSLHLHKIPSQAQKPSGFAVAVTNNFTPMERAESAYTAHTTSTSACRGFFQWVTPTAGLCSFQSLSPVTDGCSTRDYLELSPPRLSGGSGWSLLQGAVRELIAALATSEMLF